MQYTLRRSTNIYRHRETVSREALAEGKGQKACVIWLTTGLSGSGKSTLGNRLEALLHAAGRHTMLLDGDNVRNGLNRDLGFSEVDRIENIHRIGEVAKILTDAGLIDITAFISPYRADRDMVRSLFSEGEYIEVYLSTSLEVCEMRDTKGLYRKTRLGQIHNFTGIQSLYEEPPSLEQRFDTSRSPLRSAWSKLLI